MKNSIGKLVGKLFDKQEEWTINEIYQELSTNEEIELSESTLKHRIRSTLFSMKKNGTINHIKDSTYQKIPENKD